jgi:hypothetical protein
VSVHPQTPEEVTASDRKADVIAILVVFGALVLAAVHFMSGWTF